MKNINQLLKNLILEINKNNTEVNAAIAELNESIEDKHNYSRVQLRTIRWYIEPPQDFFNN